MIITEAVKEKIYLEHHGKIFRYALSRLNDRESAEDLTADVFVKVYEKLDSFDESKSSLSTWIYTICRNTLIDRYRTRTVFSEIPETLSDGSDMEESICNSETLEALASALEALEERERTIIVSRFYSGKTLREISEKLGISYSYAKALQNKAFEKIKMFL